MPEIRCSLQERPRGVLISRLEFEDTETIRSVSIIEAGCLFVEALCARDITSFLDTLSEAI